MLVLVLVLLVLVLVLLISRVAIIVLSALGVLSACYLTAIMSGGGGGA